MAAAAREPTIDRSFRCPSSKRLFFVKLATQIQPTSARLHAQRDGDERHERRVGLRREEAARPWLPCSRSVGVGREVLEERRGANSPKPTRPRPVPSATSSPRLSRCGCTRRWRSKKPPSPSSSHVETRSPSNLVERRVADGREHLVEREARGDGLAHLVERERLAQPQVLRREPLLLEPALDDVDDLFDLERLEDVVVGAALHRVDRRLDRAEAGHDDGERVRRRVADGLEQLDAAHARHLEVADDEVVVRVRAARSARRRRPPPCGRCTPPCRGSRPGCRE